MFEHIQLI